MKHRLIYSLIVAALTLALLPLDGMTSPAMAGKKTKTILGIAVGVAAGALILNEVSKAHKKKKYKKRHHKKRYHKKTYQKKKHYKSKKAKKAAVHCHTTGKRHYHKEFNGKFLHAHEAEEGCGSYRLNKKHNDGPGTGAYKPKNVNSVDPWKRCKQDFSSFSDDGTYQPQGNGPRKLCPYL